MMLRKLRFFFATKERESKMHPGISFRERFAKMSMFTSYSWLPDDWDRFGSRNKSTSPNSKSVESKKETAKMPRYTKNTEIFTMKQRMFYENNGYLLIRNLVPKMLLDACHQRFDDLVSGKVPRDGIVMMYDVKDRKSVNKLQDIAQDEVFRQYIEYKSILDVVEAFTGPNIMAMHSMLIAKPPDVGYGTSKHPPHQDLYYFPFRPADLIVASWTAMEPCTRENGCLYVAPGTHHDEKLYKHEYPPGSNNKFYHGILDLPESIDWVYLEMEPGDTVFFHPLLIHGSGVNTSNGTRRAISCHYAAAECNYIDVNGTPHSTIAEEVLSYVRTKTSPDVNLEYKDVWRFKASLVRGMQSSL